MNMIQKKVLAGIGALGAASMLLAGCGGKDPVEMLHDSMEKAVQAEKPFQKEQKTLEKLEKKEDELYNEVIQLNMNDYAKIVSLSDEALKNTEQRKQHLKTEKDSIDNSEKEFEAVTQTAGSIKDQSIKKKAKAAAAHMEKRYDLYGALYKDYMKAIQYDKELYSIIKKKDLTAEDLDKQISKVNDSYKKVLKQAGAFNKQTKEYNQAREELYKEAGFHVNEN
ncbi:YkyA family protein [Bacillus sp. L381]|uniref:YkyA family protein n=1 Tax=Bacillus TaxID=1386 RepID=UPI00082721B7|nr:MULTISPECIES: YkyA family protein [Bacillus]AOC90876.1 putative lipoprotein YkyA [Bacillus amyloliquefaciens]MCR9037974.1 YkyA family protein [Bacillus velezensis]QUN10883.1 YkyA family protein [Bacillus amyloliquefaciens]QYM84017.1 YkyA family protein [Bacillus sp. 7D3]QZY13199.1 YkyA family protein [Bacillus amyloliquefaciens]